MIAVTASSLKWKCSISSCLSPDRPLQESGNSYLLNTEVSTSQKTFASYRWMASSADQLHLTVPGKKALSRDKQKFGLRSSGSTECNLTGNVFPAVRIWYVWDHDSQMPGHIYIWQSQSDTSDACQQDLLVL